MFKKITLHHVIYLLILGAVVFVSISACSRATYQHPTSLTESSIAAECRVIQHASGETCIPIKPQRVIVLDIFSLGSAINLGVKPIAGVSIRQARELPEYLTEYVPDVKHIGVECQPNIEEIMLLKPDLLLGRSSCSQSYSLFSKIAPTVLSNWYIGTHWKENFEFVSNVLGKKEVAQLAWDQYHERIRKLRSVLAEKYQDKKISVVGICQPTICSYARNSFLGSILNDLGLQRPEAQNISADYGYVDVSEEEIQKIDGDVMFILTKDTKDNDEKLLAELKSKPLWAKLQAAQTNQIYVVKDDVWWGGNLLAANLVLDDLERYLVNAQ
jgi:iron complex transport system substrate-binding protein